MAKRKTKKKDTVNPKPGTKRRTMAKRKTNTKKDTVNPKPDTKGRTMAKRKINTKKGTVNSKPDSATGNALKCQFLTDMELAGMYPTSRKRYLYVVEQLIRHYWCSPAELTEQQVCDYLLEHHRQRPAKGTFRLTHFALRLFFKDTLGRDWDLFKKK